MATNTNPTMTRLNGRERFLDLKMDLLAALVAKDNYTNFKDLANYSTKLAKYFPKAVDYAGTFTGSVFTPTASPTWTVDELVDQYAFFYKLSDVSALLTSAANFKTISAMTTNVLKITDNTANTLTVDGTIPTGSTNVIVVEKVWYQIAQMSSYDFADTTAQIDANDQDSGGYETFINGLKSASLSGITGHFYPKFHTLVQLENAKLADSAIEVRHGATDLKFVTVYNQICTVTEFTKSGATDKTAKLEYSITLSNYGEPTVQTILADGVVPDFM